MATQTTVDERLKILLDHYKIDQAGFADKIGVTRQVINNYFTGRSKPGFEMLSKILEAFPDLSMEWLLNGQGSITKSREILDLQNKTEVLRREMELKEELLEAYRRLSKMNNN